MPVPPPTFPSATGPPRGVGLPAGGGAAGWRSQSSNIQRWSASRATVVRGSCTASISLATIWGGVGLSGLPMPRSTMSSAAARALAFAAFTSANT